jgi:hypothetical protein
VAPRLSNAGGSGGGRLGPPSFFLALSRWRGRPRIAKGDTGYVTAALREHFGAVGMQTIRARRQADRG